MSAAVAAPDQTPDAPVSLVATVGRELTQFLDRHTALLLEIHPDLSILADAARAAVLPGGKRLRPSFAYWGWRSAQPAGTPDEATLIRAASSLELLHACALVHDDVMDASNTRRGQPAAHIQFATTHRGRGWPGSSSSFGSAGAILLGDLLLSWAEEMFTDAVSQLPSGPATSAEHEFDLMRTEVVAGQFLDVLAQTRGGFDPAEALRVIEFKTSKYTVQRPLLLGAAAAGAAAATRDSLASYGHALGEAFQLRDDLLGVFGDPQQTGKPAGDDLREGKRTLLVALAMQSADARQRALLESAIGDPNLSATVVDDLRTVLTSTGAVSAVEKRIAERAIEAERSLDADAVQPEALQALLDLAHAAAHRSF
jgi:geranylgeranyl diphosphate synthase type I